MDLGIRDSNGPKRPSLGEKIDSDMSFSIYIIRQNFESFTGDPEAEKTQI